MTHAIITVFVPFPAHFRAGIKFAPQGRGLFGIFNRENQEDAALIDFVNGIALIHRH